MLSNVGRGFLMIFAPKFRVKRRCFHRRALSRILQPINVVFSGENNSTQKYDSELASKSQRLLVEMGLVQPCNAGSYAYLPLAIRSLDKLTNLVEKHLQKIGCQRIQLPLITDGSLWKESGRWETTGGELLKIRNRNERDLVFGPTFEEAAACFAANLGHIPARSLPLRLYQVSAKYRDEMRPKFGLIRSREFLMNDLYTFDTDTDAASSTYDQVGQAYRDIFDAINVPYVCVEGDVGDIGGEKSHEYHFPCDIGQDTLVTCNECGFASHNVELNPDSNPEKCPRCGGRSWTTTKGIEVGHTFLLGDKYSSIFKATFTGAGGKAKFYQMGCFGLGLTRILAASLEVLSTEKLLVWPDVLAPFKVAILTAKTGSKEFAPALPDVAKLYDQIDSDPAFAGDVVIDDREKLSVGRKLVDARKTGYTWIILFGKDSLKSSLVEIHHRNFQQPVKVGVDQIVARLKS